MPTVNYGFPMPGGNDSFKVHRDFKALGDSIDATLKQEMNSANEKIALQKYYVNVKEFGAKGDGTRDDTQSFKDAIAFAATKKTVVFIPEGVYKITSSLSVPTGVTLLGAGGWSQKTIIAQVGDFNCFELIGGYSGGCLEGIHITGFGANGLNNTAIYVKRSGVSLGDISVQSYKGIAINMDGSISEGTGSWFSKLDRIKVVGYVQDGVYYTNKGIVLGDNFNSSFLTNFTVHYCKIGIETKVVNSISVSGGNLSENKDTGAYAVKMTDAGTNIGLSYIHFEGNANGIQISKGNMITLNNLISNGYGIQSVFIDVPQGSIAQNIFIEYCSSFGSLVADLRVDNYKTYLVQVINSSLRSTVPILNLNNSEIAITSFGTTKKDSNSPTALLAETTTVVSADTVLQKGQSGARIVANSSSTINVTLPTPTAGLRFTVINSRTSGTLNIIGGALQNFNAETVLISNTVQIVGVGSIDFLSIGDRWVILSQKGTWSKL